MPVSSGGISASARPYSQEYYAGGLSYEDNGASVGSFGGVIGRFINNANGTTANNLFNAEQALLSRQFTAEEARKAREHELYMSNTAYQRAAADMQAAGINPATLSGLNAGAGGASTGSASAGSSASASAATGNKSVIGQLVRTIGTLALLAA